MRGLSLSLSLPRGISLVLLYAAIAIGGTAFFFFLHFLGNQTPHSLIQKRIATEAATDQSTSILHSAVNSKFEYCKASSMALAGSRRDEDYQALRHAIILRELPSSWFNWCMDIARGGPLDAPEVGARIVHNTRYWYGSKAIYSISIRWISVANFYHYAKFSIYASYALLGIALFLLGWRVFIVGSPVIIAGLFFAANQYFSDMVIGLPHVWTVFSIAILALLFRWEKTKRFISIFCFIIGMVSSYFWIFDGHTILAIPAIGLVGWLGYYHMRPRERMRRALAMIGLYIAGFALCFTLGQTAKSAAVAWPDSLFTDDVFTSVIENVQFYLERTASESSAGITEGDAATFPCFNCGQGWQALPVIREFRSFRALAPGSIAFGQLLGMFSGLALALAVASSIIQAWRGHTRAAWSVSWILVLLLLLCIQFMLPDDAPLRSFRMVSFAIALFWSAFILVLLSLHHKGKVILAGCFIFGCHLVAISFWIVWDIEKSNLSSIIRENEPSVSEEFDVYHHGNKLIYTRESCDSSFSMPTFALHVFPNYGEGHFTNRDFNFRGYQSPSMNCTAVVPLPDSAISHVHTGQYLPTGGIWSDEILVSWGEPNPKALRHVRISETDSPVAASFWDIFVTEGTVVYYREHCILRDAVYPFYLHIYPLSAENIPAEAREYGFENLDFRFVGHGAHIDGDCIAVRDLPSWDIASIVTGQYHPYREEQLWTAEFSPRRE